MKDFPKLLIAFGVICIVLWLGYKAGLMEAERNEQIPQLRVLNDWYVLEDDSLYVYKKGYMNLPRSERDSIRLDAINKLR